MGVCRQGPPPGGEPLLTEAERDWAAAAPLAQATEAFNRVRTPLTAEVREEKGGCG